MTHEAPFIDPERMILMTGLGVVLGLVYFVTLKRSVTMFVGGEGWLGPLALTLGRISTAVAFLFLAAKLGAAPLLAVFIGFLMARAWALRA